MDTDGRGYSGSDTGSACGGEVVTASGAGGIGTDVAVISFRTTTTTEATAATATLPTRLERSDVFLMWEVRSCSNTVPELGRVVPVYAARMAGRENSGGIYYDPPRVAMDRRRAENGD